VGKEGHTHHSSRFRGESWPSPIFAANARSSTTSTGPVRIEPASGLLQPPSPPSRLSLSFNPRINGFSEYGVPTAAGAGVRGSGVPLVWFGSLHMKEETCLLGSYFGTEAPRGWTGGVLGGSIPDSCHNPQLSMKCRKFDFLEPFDHLWTVARHVALAHCTVFVPQREDCKRARRARQSQLGCRNRHTGCNVMGAIAIIPPPSSAPPSSVNPPPPLPAKPDEKNPELFPGGE